MTHRATFTEISTAMGAEQDFGERLAGQLREVIPKRYQIETKRSLLYSVGFDDAGVLQLGQNRDGEPTRGRGSGFEQDLLVFERVRGADTSIVPRVSVELKFGRITTHDSIVYSEKARRIRSIYPYVRYGLILGRLTAIPGRTLRLGPEFDFIVATPEDVSPPVLARLAKLIRVELRLSCKLTDILRGRRKIGLLHRSLKHSAAL